MALNVRKIMMPMSANNQPMFRAMGAPVLFDGATFNLGVANKWVTLLDLTGFGDRVFVGISIYNPHASIPVFIAFEQGFGSEVKSMKIEASSSDTLDELTFGPGTFDDSTGKQCNYLRAMVASASGVAAAGTITYVSNPADGTKVVIGLNTYLFQTVVTNSPTPNQFSVLIGATLTLSLTNLVAVINAAEPLVTAVKTSGTVVTITSGFTGTGPNAMVFIDGTPASGGTFTGAGTLGGAGGTAGTAGIACDLTIW